MRSRSPLAPEKKGSLCLTHAALKRSFLGKNLKSSQSEKCQTNPRSLGGWQLELAHGGDGARRMKPEERYRCLEHIQGRSQPTPTSPHMCVLNDSHIVMHAPHTHTYTIEIHIPIQS